MYDRLWTCTWNSIKVNVPVGHICYVVLAGVSNLFSLALQGHFFLVHMSKSRVKADVSEDCFSWRFFLVYVFPCLLVVKLSLLLYYHYLYQRHPCPRYHTSFTFPYQITFVSLNQFSAFMPPLNSSSACKGDTIFAFLLYEGSHGSLCHTVASFRGAAKFPS